MRFARHEVPGLIDKNNPSPVGTAEILVEVFSRPYGTPFVAADHFPALRAGLYSPRPSGMHVITTKPFQVTRQYAAVYPNSNCLIED